METIDLITSSEGETVEAQEGSKEDGIRLSSQDKPEGLLNQMELDEDAKNPRQGKDEGVGLGSLEEQKIWLIERCLEAMKLCLTRFPQHYKSLYRMSNAYCIAPTHKVIILSAAETELFDESVFFLSMLPHLFFSWLQINLTKLKSFSK